MMNPDDFDFIWLTLTAIGAALVSIILFSATYAGLFE